jgi:hypothetical protein
MLTENDFICIEALCRRIEAAEHEHARQRKARPRLPTTPAQRRIATLRQEAAEQFGYLIDLEPAKHPFPLSALTPRHDAPPSSWQLEALVDHPDCYTRKNQPRCIVSHVYGSAENVTRLAEKARLAERGLTMVVLPCRSWYRPGDTTAVLLMPLQGPYPLGFRPAQASTSGA